MPENNIDPITQPAPKKPPAQQQTEPTQGVAPLDPEPKLIDKHGQEAISKGKYERDMAERDKKIADLEAKLAQSANDAQALAELRTEIDQVKQANADERQTWELEKAWCRDVETAKAVISNYQGDVQALKDAKPWLFEAEKKGATGLKPVGATDDSQEKLDKARKLMGVVSK